MPLNHDHLVPLLMSRYGVTLPANAIAWRATLTPEGKPPSGWIASLDIPCRMILTDGVVAWFLLGDDKLFFGHFQNFEEEKEKKPRKASAKAARLAAALEQD